MDITTWPLVGPLVQWGAAWLHQLVIALEPVAGPASAALAVVLITLAVRAVLIPLDVRMVRAEGARRRLAPHIAELRRRWKNKPEELQRRTMALYRDAEVSPVAGFGSMLAQAPIVSLLYLVLASPTIGGEPNPVRAEELLGVGFGDSLAFALSAGGWAAGVLAAAVVVLLALSGWLQLRAMRMLQQGIPAPEIPAVATRLFGVLPFVAIFPALLVPLGAALYLVVSSLWSSLERPILRRMLWSDAEWQTTLARK